MRYRQIGNSGIEASVVGLGTWVTGGGPWWGPADDEESIRVIHTALDAGINLIDTAPAYGFGHSEEVIGRAIQGRRDKVVLATKCGLWWQDQRGPVHFESEGRKVCRSVRPDTIQAEVELSLQRLRTDRIDLYQVHWPSVEPEKTPIADTMGCLMKLKQQGKIRAIGVSNVSVAELTEYAACGDLSSDQFRYSMLSRDAERDILPWCLQNNVATLTYMSLEQGLLTGQVGMDRVFAKEAFRSNETWNPWFKLENRARVLAMLNGWSALTKKYGCTVAQLVMAWTLAQPGVTHVLAGARSVSQIQENARGGALTLEAQDVKAMRQAVEALGEPIH
jgi:methylglyoxal reductase